MARLARVVLGEQIGSTYSVAMCQKTTGRTEVETPPRILGLPIF